MPRRRSAAKLIGLCVAVLAVAGVGAVALAPDQAAIKARLSEAVFRATGRQLVLAGPLSMRPGLSLALTASDVSLANAPGGSRPEMARVGRLEARVAWLPLFSREIVVERLTLARPSILLEITPEGVPNWRFEPPRPVAAAGVPNTGSRSTPWGLDLRRVELGDGDVEWRDGRVGRAMKVTIPRLTFAANSAVSLTSVDGEVGLDTERASISGQVGSSSAFGAATAAAPWPVRIVAETTAARLSVTGGIAHPRVARGYDLAFDAAVPNLSTLSDAAGFSLPAFKDVTFAAHLVDTGGSLPDLSGIALHAGAADFALDGYAALHVDHFDITAPRFDAPTQARLDGTLAGTTVTMAATLGAPASLLANGVQSAFPIDARAEAAGATMRITGGIAQPARFAGLDVTVTAGIPDLAALSPIAGHHLPGFTDLAVAGRVMDQDGGFRRGVALRDIAVTAPQGDVAGAGAWSYGGRPEVDANLSSKRLDVDAVRAILAAQPASPAPIAASPPTPAPGVPPAQPNAPARVIPDTELPFAALNRADGDVRLSVGALRIAGMAFADFVGHAVLRDGKLAVDPVGGQGAGGRVDMAANVDASVADPPVRLFLRGDGIGVKPLLATFGWPDDVAGNADVSIDLRSQGRTVRALAAGVDGHVALAIADGEIDNRMLSTALAGFLRAARLPGDLGEGRTDIRCLAMRLDAAHGLVAATTMVLDTTRLMLQGTGEVNLADEHMALRLRPMLRIGGPGLVVPIRVGGTLRDPKLALDSGGMLGALMAGERRSADACAPALASARRP